MLLLLLTCVYIFDTFPDVYAFTFISVAVFDAFQWNFDFVCVVCVFFHWKYISLNISLNVFHPCANFALALAAFMHLVCITLMFTLLHLHFVFKDHHINDHK